MSTTIHVEINGHHHKTDHQSLTGRQIKELARDEQGQLFRIDGEFRHRIADEEVVELRDGERFLIEGHEHRSISIEVDGTQCHTRRGEMTGAEIKHLASRPPGNNLYHLKGHERTRVEDNETVRLHDRERFITLPPIGHAA